MIRLKEHCLIRKGVWLQPHRSACHRNRPIFCTVLCLKCLHSLDPFGPFGPFLDPLDPFWRAQAAHLPHHRRGTASCVIPPPPNTMLSPNPLYPVHHDRLGPPCSVPATFIVSLSFCPLHKLVYDHVGETQSPRDYCEIQRLVISPCRHCRHSSSS